MKLLRFLSFFQVIHYISNCISLVNGNQTKPEPHLLNEIIPNKNPKFKLGSFHTLERLAEFSIKEESIFEVLTERLELLELERGLISSYLNDYKESTQKAVEALHDSSKNTPDGRGRMVGSSAVLSHRMTDRYVGILAKLQGLLSSDIYAENQRHIDKVLHIKLYHLMKETSSNDNRSLFSSTNQVTNKTKKLDESVANLSAWPKIIDKYMSDLSFIHIHEIYGFDPYQLQRGLTLDTKYGGYLTAKQCAEIGAHALSRELYYMAIEWLELAKRLASESQSGNDKIQVDLLSELINVAINEHNINMYNGSYYSNENFYVNETHEDQPHNERLRMRKFIFQTRHKLDPEEDRQLTALAKYWGLCSGITFQTPETQRTLQCFYDTKKHPYLYINPVKTEVLSENPPVLQFYDILANNTIEKIKAISVPRLELSQLVGVADLEEVTTHRTSAGTFLRYEEMPKLYQHSEIVSGFKMEDASEMGQVVEYTFGRYYIYHTDALEDQNETKTDISKEGDRVATMLYYLETAELGGDTPFCSAGVNANPIRGSAILWLNMYRNGSVRQDVYHGACPVVHGHKMIINHWIRYNGNWDHFKCSLNQFE